LSFQLVNPTFTVVDRDSNLVGGVVTTATVGQAGDAATLDLDLGIRNAGGDGTIPTPISALISMFTGQSLGEVLGSVRTESTVHFSAGLELLGDAGTRAIVSGTGALTGQYNHQVGVMSPLYVSWGDAKSSVDGSASLGGVPANLDALQSTHSGQRLYPLLPDFGYSGLGSEMGDLDAALMIVGDPDLGILAVEAFLTVESLGNVVPACVDILGLPVCAPTNGWAVSLTEGAYRVSLRADALPSPVPEPTSLALAAMALLAMHRCCRPRAA
jgi:hypothetical protein